VAGLIRGNHHLTFCVGPAQEDYDFHTQLLGLRSIKKTALYDGQAPVYHLYYGNANGDPGTILTSFPFRQQGIVGRRGTNQISRLNLSVPAESLGYWRDRLANADIETSEVELHGTARLHFAHPCGIGYGLVADGDGDPTRSWERGGIDAEHAILGTHGIAVDVSHPEEAKRYLTEGISAEPVGSEGPNERFALGSGHGRYVELVHGPDLEPGTWYFGEGTVHHAAYDVGNAQSQLQLKAWLEGIGYTDCSEVKDRGYFMSWSKPEGWTIDEPADRLGEAFQIPPVFADRADEIRAYLEPIDTGAGSAQSFA
jgi:glyoxalase family protein